MPRMDEKYLSSRGTSLGETRQFEQFEFSRDGLERNSILSRLIPCCTDTLSARKRKTDTFVSRQRLLSVVCTLWEFIPIRRCNINGESGRAGKHFIGIKVDE